jgi:hypothetical protein
MPKRVFRSVARRSNIRLTEVLGSLFTLELLSPSKYFYIISPYLSEVPLLDNRYGQFRSLLFDQTETTVELSTLLNALAARKTHVRVLYHPDAANFVRKLSDDVEKKERRSLHEKALISEHFWLSGSMNFTYAGVYLNDEQITLETDPEQIGRAMIDAHNRWKEQP